ncbi:MAG: lysophospholipid acyltransferase family protein [Deltaproteobacteria bacterium]|nr:lysophospholipid acyltransferase family protein [Deltaproteobacteria bacterium]
MRKTLFKASCFCVATILKLWGRTLRIKKVHDDVVQKYESQSKKGLLYPYWHQHNFCLAMIGSLNHRSISTMSSLSRDGELSASIQRYLGFLVSRGSASKGGAFALRQMVRDIKSGSHGAIAVDGSKGPLYKVKKGILYLAKLTGSPIIPLSCYFPKKIIFKSSWDQCYLPIPFSKGVLIGGQPFFISKDASEEEIENIRLQVEQELLNLQTQAQHLI